jgi:trk system potassium uptake protein TrkA
MTYVDRFRDWIKPPGHEHAAESVFVVGLGRFGSSLAETLVRLGVEVLAIDADDQLVNEFAEILPAVRQADGTSQSALRQLGIEQFDAAVVAIGTGIEASILTTAALVDVGVPTVWAKAITAEHGRILERVGAHHVVFPEKQMGERVAHAVTGAVVDYFPLDEGFVIAELEAPARFVGRTLEDTAIRRTHGVTVVCVKPAGRGFTYATAETTIAARDLLVIAGATEQVDAFIDLAVADPN